MELKALDVADHVGRVGHDELDQGLANVPGEHVLVEAPGARVVAGCTRGRVGRAWYQVDGGFGAAQQLIEKTLSSGKDLVWVDFNLIIK